VVLVALVKLKLLPPPLLLVLPMPLLLLNSSSRGRSIEAGFVPV